MIFMKNILSKLAGYMLVVLVTLPTNCYSSDSSVYDRTVVVKLPGITTMFDDELGSIRFFASDPVPSGKDREIYHIEMNISLVAGNKSRWFLLPVQTGNAPSDLAGQFTGQVVQQKKAPSRCLSLSPCGAHEQDSNADQQKLHTMIILKGDIDYYALKIDAGSSANLSYDLLHVTEQSSKNKRLGMDILVVQDLFVAEKWILKRIPHVTSSRRHMYLPRYRHLRDYTIRQPQPDNSGIRISNAITRISLHLSKGSE